VPRSEACWTIEPRAQGFRAGAAEFWRYRRLVRYFAVQVLQRTYRRTVLGWAWVLLRPLLTVVVSATVFGGVVGIEVASRPYFLFVLVGTSCWSLFENSLTWATRSLELNRRLLERQYFPRVLLPVSSTSPALVEFGIYLALLAASLAVYSVTRGELYLAPGPRLLGAVVAVVLCIGLAVAVGLWTSVLASRARDVRFVLGYGLRLWFFVTPVIYPLDSVPADWRWAAELNPMTAIVELFRWSTIGVGQVSPGALFAAFAATVVVGAAGLVFFARVASDAIDEM